MLLSVEPVGREVKAYERFHRTASHLPGLHSGSGGCKHVQFMVNGLYLYRALLVPKDPKVTLKLNTPSVSDNILILILKFRPVLAPVLPSAGLHKSPLNTQLLPRKDLILLLDSNISLYLLCGCWDLNGHLNQDQEHWVRPAAAWSGVSRIRLSQQGRVVVF